MPELNVQNHILGSNYLIFLFAVFVRWCIAIHSYSGETTPPMFGDYEAQRHWMEITYNIPIKDWYRNTNDNNLTYWGLDYPPLTAYHSFLCGLFASFFIPDSVKLHNSKGYENYHHKLFMRYSVLIVDLLIYIPAVYWYFKNYKTQQKDFSSNIYIFLVLLYPGLILIDYGHFQYNCVSLGFLIAAVGFVATQYFKTAAMLFSLAVNYKQMELYHAFPFFGFFLGKFFLYYRKRSFLYGLKFIVPIALTVLLTFLIIWFPFLSSTSNMNEVIRRIFPVSRGIYEDKVSSFWCILNIFYKLRENIDNEIMFKICFIVTFISVLPSVIDLILNPILEKFKLSLIICSLCFFLFSYHVHEKSILLVAIPVALDFSRQPYLSFWFLLITDFSMLPLMIKDGLFLPFFSLFILYAVCCVTFLYCQNIHLFLFSSVFRKKKVVIFFASFLGCIILSLISKFCNPPTRYPYLWSLAVSFYSFMHFFGFLLYYYYKQCGYLFLKQKKI